MYSTYNEGKSPVAERFIRTLKNKIYKHMKAISKNVYFHVLNDIVYKYNNTCHKTIKMKSMSKVILLLNIMKIKMLGFQSIKIFLLKDMVLIGVKKFFL